MSLFGKKKPEVPEDCGPYSAHPKSKLPQPLQTDQSEPVAPTPVPVKAILNPTELEQLRAAKFKQLRISYEKVLEFERDLNVTFDPDLVEKDIINTNHRLESYCFNFRIANYDFFTCLILIKKLAGPPINEAQVIKINSISEGIIHTDLIMNLIVWRHLEQKLRNEKKLTLTDYLPEIEIIAAGKAFWQNIDRLSIWKQAEKQLRRERSLKDNAVISKEDIEKRYQELLVKRDVHKGTPPTAPYKS